MNELNSRLVVRHLGLQPYAPVYAAMQRFTEARGAETPDELWFLQHLPVYTQGRAGKAEYLLAPADIPVVDIDRGGQVTYHGPGQLTAYTLIDIKRRGMGVRDLVSLLEQSLVATLAHWGVVGAPRADAPGVYIDGAKIAALGLRIRRGCSYHGLNFNIDMDMHPWSGINACGLGVGVTQLSEQLASTEMPGMTEVTEVLLQELGNRLGVEKFQQTREAPL